MTPTPAELQAMRARDADSAKGTAASPAAIAQCWEDRRALIDALENARARISKLDEIIGALADQLDIAEAQK